MIWVIDSLGHRHVITPLVTFGVVALLLGLLLLARWWESRRSVIEVEGPHHVIWPRG